ncbi:diguanylate cyclase [Actinoplanes sp. Pm04-4]|uniref:Sensor-like histidine kinase SenX3 n=1 Tax=Paractinoplanes pyxinae TaxID=2997416 RepID=A0ABT4ARB5_9ACTN|nr:ATP-binding protein [Actinoplanes pyxinae]MCY1136776.1 diguanylate cyclase [Actinoplanes pyxinae]
MSWRSSAARTLGFSLAFLAATWAGRLTVMDETNLSLVWPAAGVSAVWFLVQFESRWRSADVAALSLITIVVNMATGASLSLAVWFVLANVVQAGLFAWLVRRWVVQPLTRTRELWRLMAVALVSTAGGALIGPTGVWAVSGSYSWPATAVWMTRNTVSILVLAAVWFTWSHARELRLRLEYVAVVALSVGAYAAVFGINHHLPLAFTVIGLTVWAGSRLNTAFVVLHGLVFGTTAVLFTLHGSGAFAFIGSHPARALVAQAFVGMIAVVGLALALGRDERVALVRQLRTEQEATADQARLMTAIVNSMVEGLHVVDDQGRLLLRNPAVRRLMGGVVSDSEHIGRPDYYGLFHPDGTPVAPEDVPHRRALAGTDVRGMDILVRNPGVPQGRLLSVSSAVVPGDRNGARCAVTVFHDVTAERRHRDELAAFAGVVAHDLLNPLATVEGWTDWLTDALDEPGTPDDPQARDGLGRISRAARRMRGMIDDLLAYTTARDAALTPTLVDLGALANDIAIARIDQAQSAGTPVPAFDIGELSPVYADPVLVRQLLENLISNAIKYTDAGVVPRLRIRTEHANHLVTVTIDDNGIGIPEGQHESIFESFHRAHRAAGYSGTGLGLGICKRIVERHGGHISASASPEGDGSRFTFTLPADATIAPPPEEEAPAPGVTPPSSSSPSSSSPDGEEEQLFAAAGFEHASQLVLDYLHEQLPLAFWAVTRVENGRQTYLYLDSDNGYGLRQGQSHPWEDSFCIHMAAGDTPAVAVDAQAVPAYAKAGVNKLINIGTYAGAAITEPDGTLFGAICGLDPEVRANDPRLAEAEPLLVLLGRLLTAALANDRLQDLATNALLREQLSADTDALTGLPDRRGWQRIVERNQARFERLADPTVVAVIDLDGIKTINDTRGQATGDAYIKAAAVVARRAVRDTDFVARIGGDEFGLVLPGCTPAGAEAVMSRIAAELDAAMVGASVGWAAAEPGEGLEAALDRADAALYAAKQRKRSQLLSSRY